MKSFPLLTALLLAGSASGALGLFESGSAVKPPQGLHVYLGVDCGPATFIDDSRNIAVLLYANGETGINRESMPREGIAPRIARIMSYRMEKNVLVVAQDGVHYGEIVEEVGELKRFVPNLNVMMLRDRPYRNVDDTCFAPYASYKRR